MSVIRRAVARPVCGPGGSTALRNPTRRNTGGSHVVALIMRAVVYSEPGPSSVLRLEERDIPEPGPGEVRVRIAVSGVNPTDWKNRTGGGRSRPAGETVPNQDGAGTIDAVGAGVDRLTVGDRVWLYLAQHERPTGTAQEFTVVPAARVVPLPDGIDFALGASLGVPAMTAHRALTVHEFGPARLTPGALAGRTVLVAGGAGAVGHAAIQLAVWAGATELATVSSDEKAALARAAGAHQVLRYTAADIADQIGRIAPDGVDHVVEVSFAQNAELDLRVVANHGCIAFYADNGGAEVTVPVRPSFAKNVRLQGVLLYTVGADALDAAAQDITAALIDGVLPVGEKAGLPLSWFDLSETAAAHDAVEQGAVGKVLIDVAASARPE